MTWSHQARVGGARAEDDHGIATQAVGRTTLAGQLARDDADDAMPTVQASIDPEDIAAAGDSVEAGTIAVDGDGDMAADPDAEHEEGGEHAEQRADGDAEAGDEPEGGAAGADRGGERDGTKIAEDGFRDSPVELPHRPQLEQLFGMSFADVRAYTGRHARQATRALGASAFTVGNRIAFATPNPSREIVAHELAHVVQHEASPSAKTGGVETAGEHEAEQVEAAVAAGKPASAVLATKQRAHGHHGHAAHTRAPNLKANPKFGIGMAFNPPSAKRNTAEKKFSRTLWSPKNPIRVPIGPVAGLSLVVDPSLKVNGAVGAGKARTVRTNWTVDGGIGVGMAYGRPELAEVNAKLNAGVHGGFSYARTPSNWTFAGSFAIDTNFSIGVVIGRVVSHTFSFGHCDIGKLSAIKFENGKLLTDQMGWEWGKQPQAFFGLIKNAIANAKRLLELPEKAAKKAWGALKKSPGAAFKAAKGFTDFLDKAIPDLTPWDGLLPG